MFAHAQIKSAALAPVAGDRCHSLQIFDRLPVGYLAFTVPDHGCEPTIRRGEVAVIDVADEVECDPEARALYLRRQISSSGTVSLRIVEIVPHLSRRGSQDDGYHFEPTCFFAPHNRPKSADQWPIWFAQFGMLPMMADGPFDANHARAPFASLVGRVVGILIEVSKATGRRAE